MELFKKKEKLPLNHVEAEPQEVDKTKELLEKLDKKRGNKKPNKASKDKLIVQLEYVSFSKTGTLLKFVFIEDKSYEIKGKLVYELKSFPAGLEGLNEAFFNYVSENNLNISPDTNVILSTNDVFTTSLVLPKAAKSKVQRFVDNDLMDKFGLRYKDKFKMAKVQEKYRDGGLVICTSLIYNDLLTKIKDILRACGLKLLAISSINLLLHERTSKKKVSGSKLAIYVEDYYTVINVYSNGALIDQYIAPQSYEYLTGLNIVQRRRRIRELNNVIISLIGKLDALDSKATFDSADFYCNDEILVKQFMIDNPLGIQYNSISVDERDFDLFHKYVFSTKDIRPFLGKNGAKAKRGFTLIEVVVSMSIFALCGIGLITSATFLANTSGKDTIRAKAYNKIDELGQLVVNAPTDDLLIDQIGEAKDVKSDNVTTVYFDNNFVKTFNVETKENVAYSSMNYYYYTENVEGKTKYIFDIETVKIIGTNENLITNLTYTTIK